MYKVFSATACSYQTVPMDYSPVAACLRLALICSSVYFPSFLLESPPLIAVLDGMTIFRLML